MSAELPKSNLGSLIKHQKGNAFKSKDYLDEGTAVVRVSNFTADSISSQNLKYVCQEIADENRKVTLKKDDIVVATVGSWPSNPASIVGKTVRVPSKLDGALMNQNSVILRVVNNDYIDQIFLFIVLKSTRFSDHLISVAQGSANQASITLSDIFSYDVEWPEKTERKWIVSIIDTLSSKIELNRQINQIIESIAQAIFKSWFVDFEPVKAKIAAIESGEDSEGVTLAAMRAISGKTDDEFDQLQAEQPEHYAQLITTAELFPSAMQDSELGDVPEGWEVGSISDITDKIFSGGTPNTKTKAFWNGELNWFSSGETRNIIIVDTDKKITEKGAKDSSTKLAIYGDILIASAGQGHTRGQTSFCAMDTFINQSVISIRTKDIRLSSWLFFNLSRRYEEMRSISDSHSIRGSLTTKLLSGLSIIIPSESLCIEYGKIADRSLIIIAENIRQSEVLSKLRDTLLPKLLSGELEINAVNKEPEG